MNDALPGARALEASPSPGRCRHGRPRPVCPASTTPPMHGRSRPPRASCTTGSARVSWPATRLSPARQTPDVSAQADEFTGAVTIYSASYASPTTPNGWSTIGGTSSASPIWAGLTALVNASKLLCREPHHRARRRLRPTPPVYGRIRSDRICRIVQ